MISFYGDHIPACHKAASPEGRGLREEEGEAVTFRNRYPPSSGGKVDCVDSRRWGTGEGSDQQKQPGKSPRKAEEAAVRGGWPSQVFVVRVHRFKVAAHPCWCCRAGRSEHRGETHTGPHGQRRQRLRWTVVAQRSKHTPCSMCAVNSNQMRASLVPNLLQQAVRRALGGTQAALLDPEATGVLGTSEADPSPGPSPGILIYWACTDHTFVSQ